MHKSYSFARFVPVSFLVLCWLLGCCFGLLFYQSCEQLFISLMGSASGCAVSIVLLLTDVILPYSITAYAVTFNPNLIYLICFIKSFLYSLSVFSLYGLFSGGAWLIHLLYLFTNNASFLLLFVCWIDFFVRRRVDFGLIGLFASLSCIFWIVDYYFVSPFVVSILR